MHYLLNWVGGCFYLTVYISGNRFTFKMKWMLIFLSCYLLNALYNVFLGKLPVRLFRVGFKSPKEVPQSCLLDSFIDWRLARRMVSPEPLLFELGGFAAQFLPPISTISALRGAISLVFWVVAGLGDQCWSSPVILTYQALKSCLGLQPWLPSIPLQCLLLYSIVMYIL